MTHSAPRIDTAADPVHTPEDLRDRWSTLMSPLGFSEHLLWYAFVGPDRCLIKVLHHVEVGPVPRPDLVDAVVASLGEVIAELDLAVTIALLVTRPGRDGVTVADRQWATMLTGIARRYGVALQPIFRANDQDIRQIIAG